MAVLHWIPRSTARDIAAEALRSDRARPTEIRVRSEVARRIGGLPVVIDDTLPRFPGFEIVREAP